ncbi:MAG: serine protease; identified by sequence similarity; putative; ORF located using Blastx/Glimmer [uncultured Sulfurovum sp.]|uniref:Serine protease identified by sequence similarity putative ORF located using Blastx/Glimmer n=1 Tax=uncultured Sulfurovum sp. TaxID=269237 RepID=A0A6S6TVM0_9BACT|nr:MAG: serine protease; identified by sequence similarity; putative; ORF located using Blastx/Glimmer [uncultured Sulfurovum sp.]
MKLFITVLLSTLFVVANASQEDITKQAIVKIYTTSKVANYLEPWNSSVRSSTGSGAIIEGGYILTNAHVVANQSFLEVQRYGQRKRYIATVYAVSHQADLALLKVEDEAFFKGVEALTFGTLPKVEQKIVVYGYPMGGSTLSATIGVVSRVEHHTYAHSGESFLAVQVDAAVNPGNSGGPALSNGKIVGVVMQVIKKSQNIGYLVPISMVKHFIDDMKDGKYNGFADLGISTQKLENPALRRYYKLDENTSGKLIDKVVHNSSLSKVLQVGDILTAVDGHNVENDGTVEFRKHEYTHFHHFIDAYQMGDVVKLDIIRDQKPMTIEATLKYTADDMYLVKTTRYDEMPTYAIYGGYVFSPLTRNLIRATNRNRLKLSYLASRWKEKDKDEVVVLLKVLASDISRGDNNFGMWPIEKVNGKTFKNFKEFYELVEAITEQYIVLEDNDGVKVIIDKKEVEEKQQKILKQYNIEFDKSEDLRS